MRSVCLRFTFGELLQSPSAIHESPPMLTRRIYPEFPHLAPQALVPALSTDTSSAQIPGCDNSSLTVLSDFVILSRRQTEQVFL